MELVSKNDLLGYTPLVLFIDFCNKNQRNSSDNLKHAKEIIIFGKSTSSSSIMFSQMSKIRGEKLNE